MTDRTLLVDEARLSSGYKKGGFAHTEPIGDIYASCCIHTIPSGIITKPFRYNGMVMIATSLGGVGDGEAYRILTPEQFADDSDNGEPTTYGTKTRREMPDEWYLKPENRDKSRWPGDYARNDPKGFYHGMEVKWGGKRYVITGPKYYLKPIAAAPQGDLFS